ncbi:MAG: ATP-binding protein, partial [Cyanobacteria bacterium J06597_16]
KYTPADGRVTLQCRQRGRWVIIEVIDTGVGIPAQDLSHIFERFQQVDSSDSRKKGGTGLGLAICRKILNQHGGRIWAQSQLSEGSTFHVLLPVR